MQPQPENIMAIWFAVFCAVLA